jgi:carbon monoxide dehydrogenase subunit G
MGGLSALEIAAAVLAVLAVIVVAMLLVGRSLPVAHTASRTITLRRSPQDVWAAVSDPDFMRSQGAPKVEVVDSQAPRRLVTRVVGETAFGGTWTFDIAPAGAGSTLTITENGEVYNAFFRFMSRYVIGHHRTIDGTMATLRKRFGEA